jgi:hypothetical protein
MNWFAITTKDAQKSAAFSDVYFNRTSLKEHILSEKNSKTASANLYDIVVNILAWGGMSYRHGRRALRSNSAQRGSAFASLCFCYISRTTTAPDALLLGNSSSSKLNKSEFEPKPDASNSQHPFSLRAFEIFRL